MAAELPLTLPEADWQCAGCGECCRTDWIVPVDPAVAAQLDGWYRGSATQATADPELLQLKHGGADCVFLLPDGICRIHCAHGYDAKPLACRLFPVALVRTPDSIDLSFAWDCPQVLPQRAPSAAARATGERLAAAAGERIPQIAAPHGSSGPLAWETYRRFRDWYADELAGQTRVRDLVRLLVRAADTVSDAWQPPDAEQRLDLMLPCGDDPLARRRALVLLLRLAEQWFKLPPSRQSSRSMSFAPAGWTLPVSELERLMESLEPEAEQLLRCYLREQLRRQALARGGTLPENARLFAVAYRLTLLFAAAAALQRSRERIDRDALLQGARQCDRYFSLHLRLTGAGLLADAARGWLRSLLTGRQFLRTVVG